MNIAPQRIDGHPNLRTSPHQHVLNRADFNEKFLDPTNAAGFRGVDVWRWLRGRERRYTYHPRGIEWGKSCDRVDLVVAGWSLVGWEDRGKDEDENEERKAAAGGAEDERARINSTEKGALAGTDIYDNHIDRGHSDHVPLSVSLDLKAL